MTAHNGEIVDRLASSCTKALLSALAFAALAFGLAEKYRELYRFRAFGQYTLGRDLLHTALSQLKEDPCWEAYARVVGDKERLAATTLSDLEGISCDYLEPMRVKKGNHELTANGDSAALDNSRTDAKPPPVVAPTQATKSQPVAPSAPTAMTISVFYNLSAESLNSALRILWDDKDLNIARTYSNSAGQEIFRWQSRRTNVSQRRGVTFSGDQRGAAPPPTMVALVTSNLTISDLEYLNSLPRSALSDFDRSMREDFRAALPNSSLGVTMGTATFAVAFAIALFAVALAAYSKAIGTQGGFGGEGALLKVVFGSVWYELAILTAVGLPITSLASLIWDVSRTVSTLPGESLWGFWPLFLSAFVTGIATWSVLRVLWPHLRVVSILRAMAGRVIGATRFRQTARTSSDVIVSTPLMPQAPSSVDEESRNIS